MYNQNPSQVFTTEHRSIPSFLNPAEDENIDMVTVESFGEEWSKFKSFSNDDIDAVAAQYFDVLDDSIINSDTIMADFGCGTGRWMKHFIGKAKLIVGIDPSKAIFIADKYLGNEKSVELCNASISNIPFPDNHFDFGMSIGVLHHIPDTQQAMKDCVKKIKSGGHFYTYIYYSLDNRSPLFRTTWKLSNVIRLGVSKLPKGAKHLVCDSLAVLLYMPFILTTRALRAVGVSKKVRSKIPLSFYENTSFYIIRNDSLDRFGTPLEQRFSKQQIETMMKNCGLDNIRFSDGEPYWHVVGQKM